MKLYWTMPTGLMPFYQKELEKHRAELSRGNLIMAWYHLERAHVLGQPYPREHTYVHWRMLLFGIRIKNGREIIGQIPRLLVGGVKSFVGNIPVGNTGGANVPPLQPMPIGEDLALLIEQFK
jgi:hypothetical protein